MTEAVIVSGVRTAIGNYGGALRDTPLEPGYDLRATLNC